MCRLRIAHPPSHIQAAQGFLVAAPVAWLSATVAAGNNQYTMGDLDVTNAHSRQQPRTHTSRTLERVLTASNVLGGINACASDESPPAARTDALAGIVTVKCVGTKRCEWRQPRPVSGLAALSACAHRSPSTPTTRNPHTQAHPRIPWTTRAARTGTRELPRRSPRHKTHPPRCDEAHRARRKTLPGGQG